MKVIASGQSCGAEVTGVDLTQPLSDSVISDIRAAWLEYHVLSFPDQDMSDDDLERFTLYFGPFGDDPFIAPIKGRKHIIAVKRLAEKPRRSLPRRGYGLEPSGKPAGRDVSFWHNHSAGRWRYVLC